MLTFKEIKKGDTNNKIFKNEVEPLNLLELQLYGDINYGKNVFCISEIRELQENSSKKIGKKELIDELHKELKDKGYVYSILNNRLLVVRVKDGVVKKEKLFSSKNVAPFVLLVLMAFNIFTILKEVYCNASQSNLISVLSSEDGFRLIIGLILVICYSILCSLYLRKYRTNKLLHELSKKLPNLPN